MYYASVHFEMSHTAQYNKAPIQTTQRARAQTVENCTVRSSSQHGQLPNHAVQLQQKVFAPGSVALTIETAPDKCAHSRYLTKVTTIVLTNGDTRQTVSGA